jgi:hypothetical protein
MMHIAGPAFALFALVISHGAEVAPVRSSAGETSSPAHREANAASAYTGPGEGSVGQTVGSRLSKQIYATDYGAKCDGATDDTRALDAAYAAAESLRATLFMPNGTCLTTGNAITTASYSAQFAIIGFGRNQTILKKTGVSPSPILSLGSKSATIYTANVEISGITFDGSAPTTRAAVETYDLVRSHIHDVQFVHSDIGYMSYGGIANSIENVVASGNRIGMKFTRFASAAKAGYPNLNHVIGSQIVDNSEWGIWFDQGRMLVLTGDNIEGNGGTFGAMQGGLYVGPNIGSEVTTTAPESQGVVVENAWFENNSGIADAIFDSGTNVIRGTQFFSTARQVEHDIQINAGRYKLENVNSAFLKPANVLEGKAVRGGNIITLSKLGNIINNASLTSIFDGSTFVLRGGQVPTVRGIDAPLVETGDDQSSGNPAIVFGKAFRQATTPRIYTQIIDNDFKGMGQIEAYDISNSGFKVRKKYFDGSSLRTKNYKISWLAIGEGP